MEAIVHKQLLGNRLDLPPAAEWMPSGEDEGALKLKRLQMFRVLHEFCLAGGNSLSRKAAQESSRLGSDVKCQIFDSRGEPVPGI